MEANQDPSRIAVEWIEKWSHAKAIATANSTASGLDEEIPKEHPELCVAAILGVFFNHMAVIAEIGS
jgi:hypothetical protein